jgi:hypothetical protein
MKTGSPLADVIQRVDRQARAARDYLAHSRHVRFDIRDSGPTLTLDDGARPQSFALSDTAHEQIATALDIPAAYYRRMRSEQPQLLATNVNAWLSRSDERRLVRTSDIGVPHVRALLSDRYRQLDHAHLLMAVLPTLQERNVRFVSTELTDRRLYLKALNERLTGEVKVGQTVMAGIAISNSEIGLGALTVQPLIYTLACTNGMIVESMAMRRHHVGKRHGGGDEIQHLLSDETRAADDRAFYLKVRDITRAALDEAVFHQQLDAIRRAAGQAMPAEHLGSIVEITARRFNLSTAEGEGILAHLRNGGDLSQWGLCSAITRHSQDLADYDRASDLERIGGQVVALRGPEWSRLISAN